MKRTGDGPALGGSSGEAFVKLIRTQLELGRDLVESVTGRAPPRIADQLRRMDLPAATGCEVPTPCWMPQPLGECTSYVSPCRTGSIRFVVTNCDRTARKVSVRTTGSDRVSVSPGSRILDPMERTTFEARVRVPEDAERGSELEAIVWVEGCNQHFLRWTVRAGSAGFDSCHEIEVEDCPDHVHHWYDHFYCERPCFHERRSTPNEAWRERADG